VLVTDGDSGRGDSDHDTGSCEEKGDFLFLY